MSTTIMSACWRLQMSPAQKAVLVSLADQANDDGVCWPAVGTIAMRTCLSDRAVQTAIRWLASAGALQIHARAGRSTVFKLTPAAYAPPQEMHPAGNAPTPEPAAPPPPHLLHPTPAAPAPRTVKEPPFEPSKNPKRAKRAPVGFDASSIELPVWLEQDDWERWVQDRKARRKPITEDAARLQLAALDQHRRAGHTPKSVIDHSIESGYQRLVPPHTATTKQPPAGRFDPVAHMNRKAQGGQDDESRTVDVTAVRVA